jgi:hypothetical protein
MTSSNFSDEPSARPGQLRTIAFCNLFADKAGQARIAGTAHGFHLARTTFGGGLVERGAAHRDDEFLIGAGDGGDCVAGIDRTREGLVAFDRENVGDLHDIEKRGDARRDILARGRGRRHERIMMAHQIGDQRRDIFRQRIGISGIVGKMDLADTGNLCSLIGHGLTAGTGDNGVDFAKLRRGRHCGKRRVFHLSIVMLNPYERLH